MLLLNSLHHTLFINLQLPDVNLNTYAAEPTKVEEAVNWLLKSATAGYVRAQYQLALCLHQGRGVNRNLKEAVSFFFIESTFFAICE